MDAPGCHAQVGPQVGHGIPLAEDARRPGLEPVPGAGVGEAVAYREALALVADQRSGLGRLRFPGLGFSDVRDHTQSSEDQKDRFRRLERQDHIGLPLTEVRRRDEDLPGDPDGHNEAHRKEHAHRGTRPIALQEGQAARGAERTRLRYGLSPD
jgi:hypothetical protein